MRPVDGRGDRGCGPSYPTWQTLNVSECREHAGIQVVKEVAVKGPGAWRVVGIKGYHHTPARGDQDGITYCPREALAVDLDDLELVTVQMHRMRHPGPVDHHQLDPFSVGDRQWRDIRGPGDVVERPDVFRHVAGQVYRVNAVGLARLQRLGRAQAALEIERQSRRGPAGRLRNARDIRTAGRQHDAGLPAFAFHQSEDRISGGLSG